MLTTESHPALHRLQRVLDSDANRHDVAEALEEAEKSGEEIPELLAFRTKERLDAEKMLERRRLLFAIGAMIAIFASVIGSFGLTTLQNMRSVDNSAKQLQSLIDAEQWDEAAKMIESLDNETLSSGPFVEAKQTIDQALRERAARAEQFKRLVAELKVGPQDHFDPVKVEKLRTLASSDDEIEIAEDFHAKAEEQRLIREAGRADGQTSEFQSLQNEVDNFFAKESKTLSPDDRDERRNELRRKMNRFISTYDLSNPELAESARQTVALLSRQGKQDAMQNKRDEAIASISAAVGDVDRYTRELTRFVEAFPDDPMTSQLNQSIESADKMKETLKWIEVFSHDAFTQHESADAAEASNWLKLVVQTNQVAGGHPLSKRCDRWIEYFESVEARAHTVKDIKDLFEQPLMQRIYVYPDPEGNIFYSSRSPRDGSDRAHVVDVFQDPSLSTTTKNFGLRYKEQVRPNVRLAGHSQYAVSVANQVSSLNENNFTQVVYGLINDLRSFKSDPTIDPIYRLQLMRKLLKVGVDGSIPIRTAFSDWLEHIEQSKFPYDLNWISPPDQEDGNIRAARRRAEGLLAGANDWDGRVSKMLASFRTFRSPRPAPPNWIGWVAQNDHQFVVLPNGAKSRTDEMVIVHRAVPDAPPELVPIAFADDTESSEGLEKTSITNSEAQHCGAIVLSL